MDLRLRFNENADNYDEFRPTYPDELFSDIINYSGIGNTSKVLEIGIGTGQATPPILETGCHVTAIELGDSLAKFTKEKFGAYNNIEIINIDFMEYTLEEDRFDLIYCATAFHWLPREEGYRKVKEALRENGTIALFWNHPFPNRKDDISNVVNRRVYDKFRPSDKDIIEFSEHDCQKRILELERFGFRDIQAKLYQGVRTLTTDAYISLLNTYSDHRALDIEIKSAFETEMRNALDEIGGKINIYDTIDLYLARK
ncbi:MAG: methyltransferase [Firmicutes bacterium GWF2_51_9]|nr:class I SAM-dependent methyltransferase [Erysipelotrichaceae bacterium]OGS54502.1 MAG: methyltransferase [Firmicutes bacterium GWF2_51_9]OGS59630.1 MAG: methyltransferase [Firmicutes bacterium GWE2_51_13]HBZ41606.1 class I SAM-dependent methyltransferase [Erysipelotrichaceae bacterium]